LASSDPPASDSPDLFGAFWRYRWAVLIPGLLGAAIGFWNYVKTPETYRSTTRLMVETDRPAMLDSLTGEFVGGIPSTDIIQSQLYSDQVVKMAFEDPLIQPFHPQFDHDFARYNSLVQSSMKLVPEVGEGGGGQTLVLSLHFDTHNRELSEASVRAFSAALQEFFDARQKSSRSDLISLIGDAMERLQPRISHLEDEYREFRREAPLAWDADGNAINPHRERQLFLVQRRSEILEELREKQVLLGAVESVAEKSEDPLVALKVVSQLLGVRIEVPSAQIEDPTTSREGDATLAEIDVDKELIPLMIQRNKYAAEFGDNHPTVRQLDAELTLMKAELKRLVKEETEQILKLIEQRNADVIDPSKRAREAIDAVLYAANSEIELLRSQIKEVDQQIETERSGSMQLAKYEQDNVAMLREIDRTRELMDQLQEQMARVSLTDDDNVGTRVVELRAPTKAYLIGPVLLTNVGQGLAIGLVIGAALAFLLEKNASTFRTPDEISQVLGVPVLTHIPSFKTAPRRGRAGEPREFDALDPSLAVLHQPTSVVAEAVRSFRTSVFFESNAEGCTVLQVTSPLPGDGKSTVAGNLACSIAQSGKRVLVIDCDLRRPQLTDNFALASNLGLTNVLNGECELEDATHTTPLPNLSVMPSGPVPSNPAEALSLPEMDDLLYYLREQYDYVIVDTPPLLVVTDPSIIASKVDGVVLTLRIRRKSKHNATESINILRGVNAKVLGVVINNSDDSGISDGYQGYGYYRYGSYTSRYQRSSRGGSSHQSGGLVVSGRRQPRSGQRLRLNEPEVDEPEPEENLTP